MRETKVLQIPIYLFCIYLKVLDLSHVERWGKWPKRASDECDFELAPSQIVTSIPSAVSLLFEQFNFMTFMSICSFRTL